MEMKHDEDPNAAHGYLEGDDSCRYIIRARGLPWSVSAAEIMKFFSDAEVLNGEAGVHITYTREGRPSGECFVELASEDDLQKALGHNNEHMGKRYIEVFESKCTEMEWVIKKANPKNSGEPGDAVVRLRGLPFGCSKQDIANFFAGLEIVPYGITITLDQDGRCTGDAFVEFTSPQEAEKALQKHKEKIGHRYIEVFKSCKADIKYVVGPKLKPLMSVRPTPYDRPAFGGRARGRGANFGGFGPSGFNEFGFDEGYGGPSGFGSGMGSRGRGRGMRGGVGLMQNRRGAGGKSQLSVMNSTTGHSVHMRGLPFEATDHDIHEFFTPLNPVQVRLIYEQSGRPKGEADVDFATHEDATAAMKKDKQHMGHRYIELFLQSSPGGSSWGGQGNRSGFSKSASGYGMNGGGNNMSGSGGSGYGGGYGSSRYNSSSYSAQGGGSGVSSGSGFGQNGSYGGYQGSGGSYGSGGGGGGGSGSGMESRSGYGYGSGNQSSFASDITYPHVGGGGFFGGQNSYR